MTITPIQDITPTVLLATPGQETADAIYYALEYHKHEAASYTLHMPEPDNTPRHIDIIWD